MSAHKRMIRCEELIHKLLFIKSSIQDIRDQLPPWQGNQERSAELDLAIRRCLDLAEILANSSSVSHQMHSHPATKFPRKSWAPRYNRAPLQACGGISLSWDQQRKEQPHTAGASSSSSLDSQSPSCPCLTEQPSRPICSPSSRSDLDKCEAAASPKRNTEPQSPCESCTMETSSTSSQKATVQSTSQCEELSSSSIALNQLEMLELPVLSRENSFADFLFSP